MAMMQQSRPSLAVGCMIAVCWAFCAGAAGCGAPAAPLPPSLNLPNPIRDLAALRIGNSVKLTWTMPTRTTDKVVLHNPVPVQVCRAVQASVCVPIANVNLAPGAAGLYIDHLTQNLVQGPDLLLRYEVAVQNHAGKSAGPSNAAYSAAGAAPPPLNGLTAQVRSDGVLLSWQAVPEPGRPIQFRIERLQVNRAPERPRSPLAESTLPLAQTLAVLSQQGADPGHAIDASAQFNQQYRYTLQRIALPDLSGHPVEVQGSPSDAIIVNTTDKFPPATPQGLVAVADPAERAIDLSWIPDTESDLAGYRIYRRDMQAGSPLQRIASLAGETSFRDLQVQAGHSYAYSVSAVDQSNNESQPSPAVEETLPSR